MVLWKMQLNLRKPRIPRRRSYVKRGKKYTDTELIWEQKGIGSKSQDNEVGKGIIQGAKQQEKKENKRYQINT